MVAHILAIDPEQEWRSGLLGMFTRWRAIVPINASAVAGTAWTFWKSYPPAVVGSGVVVSASLLALLLINRHFRIQRTLLHRHFHFTHLRKKPFNVVAHSELPTIFQIKF